MRGGTQLALGAAIVAGLGAVAGTVWVGSLVSEEKVVESPYEEGLRYDADRRARAALGWDVALRSAPTSPGPARVAFEVRDGRGAPVEGAAVKVSVQRPDTSREVGSAEARASGGGSYEADVTFPGTGPWLVAFEVRRGAERVHVERTIEIPTATPTATAPPTPTTTTTPVDVSAVRPERSAADEAARSRGACRLDLGPCTAPLGGGMDVTLELSPRPLRTLRELSVAAGVRGAPPDAAVEVSFEMKGMDMGTNLARLAPAGHGRFAGTGVLVRCPSGRKDWIAEVAVSAPGAAPRTARFDLAVEE